jgi:hypothetical protein
MFPTTYVDIVWETHPWQFVEKQMRTVILSADFARRISLRLLF